MFFLIALKFLIGLLQLVLKLVRFTAKEIAGNPRNIRPRCSILWCEELLNQRIGDKPGTFRNSICC